MPPSPETEHVVCPEHLPPQKFQIGDRVRVLLGGTHAYATVTGAYIRRLKTTAHLGSEKPKEVSYDLFVDGQGHTEWIDQGDTELIALAPCRGQVAALVKAAKEARKMAAKPGAYGQWMDKVFEKIHAKLDDALAPFGPAKS